MGLVTRRSEQLDRLFDQFAVDPKKPKAKVTLKDKSSEKKKDKKQNKAK